MNGQTRASAALGLFLCFAPILPAFAQDAPDAPQEPPPPAQDATAPALQTQGPDRPVLELSLDEAVKRAMENNLDIAVERFNPDFSAQGVRQVEGAYDPYFSSTLTKNSQTDPPRSAFTGGEKVDTDIDVYNVGLFQSLKTGGTLSVDFNNNRTATNNVFSTFNPIFNSTFNAQLTQPLLRNLRIDGTRQQLRIAKKNREISDVQFRQTVTNTLAGVKQAYYNLLYAIENLDAQRRSLSLAKKLLDENQIKVRVGTMAPLDVVSAESEVATREEGVIVAENLLAEAEDIVKQAIFPKSDPETWALRIVPTDRPSADPVPVDVNAALQRALENRTDMMTARKNLESADISLEYARNQTLPGVDLVAAYGSVGIGGTQLRDAFGDPLPLPISGGYGDAVSTLFDREFPSWSIGVNLTYPLFNRQARATSARARISREQSLASIRRLEMQIAAEVRSAARAVETDMKRVESTRAARVLSVRRLDAEEKKFAAGMSTNFLVTQAQRDLALAEVAEIRAIADYRNSLVNFERVQEAGFGGGGGTLTISSSSGTNGGRTGSGGTGGNGGSGQGTGTSGPG
jgi:outer membrane protein TolC